MTKYLPGGDLNTLEGRRSRAALETVSALTRAEGIDDAAGVIDNAIRLFMEKEWSNAETDDSRMDTAVARGHNAARQELRDRGFRMYRRFPDGDISVESWRHGVSAVPGVLLYCHHDGWDIYLEAAALDRDGLAALDAHRAKGGW